MKRIIPRIKKIFSSNIDIFISHSSKDQSIVEEIIKIIIGQFGDNLKIRCTSVVRYKIEPGKHIENQIKDDILNAKLVIALLSKDSLGSGHVQNEIGGAWILNKAWVLLHYEDDIRDQLKSFVKNYELTPIYDLSNLRVLFKYLGKLFEKEITEDDINSTVCDKLFEEIRIKMPNNNLYIFPYENPANEYEKIFNLIYYRDYNKAYHKIKKEDGHLEVYRLIKDLYFVKNVTSKFRLSRQEEDEERVKILKVMDKKNTKKMICDIIQGLKNRKNDR